MIRCRLGVFNVIFNNISVLKRIPVFKNNKFKNKVNLQLNYITYEYFVIINLVFFNIYIIKTFLYLYKNHKKVAPNTTGR
jgi:hypothetical protein